MGARFLWCCTVAAAIGATIGCSDAECVTDMCAPVPPDGGHDAGGPGDARDGAADGARPDGAEVDAGRPCRRWADLNGCVASGSCPDPTTITVGLELVDSRANAELPQLESVSFIPGSDGVAIAMSAEHVVVEVLYDDEGITFGRARNLPVELSTQFTTSVKVHPSGRFAAVAVADVDCAPGEVMFLGLGDRFGVVLGRVTVGFMPDNGAFSPDGRYFVTADEDERSNRPCKPADRHGGSISIVEVGDGPASAVLRQIVPIDHAVDSEPESVAVGADGTVVATLQETSELAILSLADVPAASPRIVALPAGGAPDGVAYDAERGVAVVGLERTDDLVVVDVATGSVSSVRDLIASGDVPSDYNRDASGTTEVHEPEQIVLFGQRGALFVAVPMQESHALVAYRLESDGTLSLDSVVPTGVGWMLELGGRARSRIGPEGLAVRPDVGLFLVANEREGSLTLARASDARYEECP